MSKYLDLELCVKKLATTAQKTSISTQTPLPCPVICFGIFAVHSTCPPRVAIWEFMAPDQPTTLSLCQSLSQSVSTTFPLSSSVAVFRPIS